MPFALTLGAQDCLRKLAMWIVLEFVLPSAYGGMKADAFKPVGFTVIQQTFSPVSTNSF